LEAQPGGKLEPSLEMWSCRFSLHDGGADVFRVLLEITFSVWLIYYVGVELSEMYVHKLGYFFEAWNYIEWANLFLYVYSMVTWFAYVNGTHKDLKAFRTVSLHEYHDLYTIAKGFNSISLASFNLVYGFIRFAKYLQVNTHFRLHWGAMSKALEMALPLLTFWLVLLFVFAWSGHTMFGYRVDEFSSLDRAFMTLLLSVGDGLPMAQLLVVAPTMSFLWCSAWYILSSLLVLNVLLAIIINSFHVVKERVTKQEYLETQALAQNIKMPSLLLAKFQEATPLALLRKSTKEQNKAAKEEQENIAELVESLSEVDLGVLSDRLVEAAMENQLTIDAIALKDCFGGSQRKARLFINRVCTLANLAPANIVDRLTTLEAANELQSVVDRLEAEVHGCRQDFEKQSPMVRVFLPQGTTLRGRRGFLGKRRSPPTTNHASVEHHVASQNASTGPDRGRGAETMSATGLLKAPDLGELGVAASALELKRARWRAAEQQGATQPAAAGQSLAVWTADEEQIHGRYAVASYITSDALKRF